MDVSNGVTNQPVTLRHNVVFGLCAFDTHSAFVSICR